MMKLKVNGVMFVMEKKRSAIFRVRDSEIHHGYQERKALAVLYLNYKGVSINMAIWP